MTDMVTITIDGQEISVPKGTLLIRAAEELGIHIPRFCDHPLLKPVGACRQCLVEVAAPDRTGTVRPMPKPQSACTMTVMPGMQVSTQRTSEVAKKAQQGVMEFLLINHPLDCPVCDKGGECPLQNQALSHGRDESRFVDVKRTYEKPVALSSQILLDRERCILCQRCIRFSEQIAGDPFIYLQGRGGGTSPAEHHHFMGEQIGTFDSQVLGFVGPDNQTGHEVTEVAAYSGPEGEAAIAGGLHQGPVGAGEKDASGRVFSSYFSGNTIQICPVGALTSASYRFRGRPFDLASTRGVTEQDASGAVLRTDIRRGVVLRRMAQKNMDVNEEWISDKDRFAFQWQFGPKRLQLAQVRVDGKLVDTSWYDAMRQAAKAIAGKRVGFLPGGRLSFEDAYAWSKFARTVANTNDIDARARVATDEELNFLAAHIAGNGMPVTYNDIEKAGQVLLVGLEPEDECATMFLRLRKGVLNHTVKVATIAPFTSAGSYKMSAQVLRAAPGTEPEVVAAIDATAQNPDHAALAQALAGAGAVILVGERAADISGLLSAVSDLAQRTGAKLAWVPRRSGERGAIEAGALPTLLPFGRLVTDAEARVDMQTVWGGKIPTAVGRDFNGILEAAASGELDTLVIGGVDPRDIPDQQLWRDAVSRATVISLEVNRGAVSEHAQVVLPVAPVSEKPGTFINWEGRLSPFGQVLATTARPDRQILQELAEVLDADLALPDLKAVHAEANELMDWDGKRPQMQAVAPQALVAPAAGTVALATYKPLLDDGLLQAGAPHLAGTARRPVARLSQATAQALGVKSGEMVTVSTENGSIALPAILSDIPDNVVWLPQCSIGSHVYESLGAGHGAIVNIKANQEVAR